MDDRRAMTPMKTLRSIAVAFTIVLAAASPGVAQQAPSAPRTPDVIFVPTPADVVDAMLKLAKVTSSDVVYDLGSGDGRIPIAAAKTYGAHGVGIDIDPERVREATQNAKSSGVADKVTFKAEDLFTADIGPATVVTHAFDMGDWKPQQMVTVNGRPIYLWMIPQPSRK